MIAANGKGQFWQNCELFKFTAQVWTAQLQAASVAGNHRWWAGATRTRHHKNLTERRFESSSKKFSPMNSLWVQSTSQSLQYKLCSTNHRNSKNNDTRCSIHLWILCCSQCTKAGRLALVAVFSENFSVQATRTWYVDASPETQTGSKPFAVRASLPP